MSDYDYREEIDKEEPGKTEVAEAETEDKKKDDDDYEKVCISCRRPESIAGQLISLPNNIDICRDCLQKSLDAILNSPLDYGQFMNMPNVQFFNMSDMGEKIPKKQKLKKKKKKGLR